MLVNEHLIEQFFAEFTIYHLYVFLLLLFFLLALFFLSCFQGSPKVLRSCFPIIACLFKSLTLCLPQLLFLLLQLVLLDYLSLYYLSYTCSLEVSLFASELNYFLLDINTNLHAFACFSRAFRLNFRPHPSGHSTNSFSFCIWSVDYSTYSYFIGILSLLLPTGISSTLLIIWVYCFYFFISACFNYSFCGSLAIKIRFFWVGSDSYETNFFDEISGESCMTSFKSSLVLLILSKSFGGWSATLILLSDNKVFDFISMVK